VNILMSALAIDPRSRYQTADELAESLEKTGLAEEIPLTLTQQFELRGAYPEAPTRIDLPAVNPRMPGAIEATSVGEVLRDLDGPQIQGALPEVATVATSTCPVAAILLLLMAIMFGSVLAVHNISLTREQQQIPATLVCDEHDPTICSPCQ
jgi:hypothetical protein